VVARELAERGAKVLVLEVGARPDPHAIPTARPDWEQRIDAYTPGDPRRDRIVYGPGLDPKFEISRYKGVGGSTMHYEGFCTRVHPADLRRRSELGLGADWPLAYTDLAPLYDRVEARLGISGVLDNPFDPPRKPYPNPAIAMSCAVARVKRGCDALGLHACHAPLAILSRPAPERGDCNFCGGCWAGCMRGAISNAWQAYLRGAEGKGLEIRTGAMVTRVLVREDGKTVEGVEYLDDDGALQRRRARVVALCGNAVETPRLLLRSARPDHPDGLANGSGAVGRYFSLHTVVSAVGLLAERVDAYKGPNINGMVQDFYDHRAGRGFAGGYVVALRNAELGPLNFEFRHARPRGLFGKDLLRFMDERFGHSVTIDAYGEFFATVHDRVTLDPEVKDSFGLAAPRIDIRLRGNEHAMLDHMEKTLREILDACGAEDPTVRERGFLKTNLMGSCRMGSDPKQSVADAFGETHDVANLFIADGSLLPTSTPSNPTLTLQALATRVSDRIAERLRQG
jgi:choline dehydrogenase-like flavoprotein